MLSPLLLLLDNVVARRKTTGAYTVVETKAQKGYQLDNAPKSIQVKVGESQELTFENAPLGGLTAAVKDANTREPFAGVVVKIITIDGKVVGNTNGKLAVINEGLTSSNGIYITVENIKYCLIYRFRAISRNFRFCMLYSLVS